MTDKEKCAWCDGSGRRLRRHSGTLEQHGIACACQTTDLPISFVYQLEENGCGIAAVAMATGRSYGDVRRLLEMSRDLSGETDGSVDVVQAFELLDHLGYALRSRYRTNYRLNCARDPWPCEPFADTHVVNVRSLSDSGGHFVVLLRDRRVLDPWWGVVSGLHRYPEVYSITGVYPVSA